MRRGSRLEGIRSTWPIQRSCLCSKRCSAESMSEALWRISTWVILCHQWMPRMLLRHRMRKASRVLIWRRYGAHDSYPYRRMELFCFYHHIHKIQIRLALQWIVTTLKQLIRVCSVLMSVTATENNVSSSAAVETLFSTARQSLTPR